MLKWNTYLSLLNYIDRINDFYQSISSVNIFDKYGIPQIVDENYLKNLKEEIPDLLYYQLQFIFNFIDNQVGGTKLAFFLTEKYWDYLIMLKKYSKIYNII